MRDIYVISDTHFGHENIIRYCSRPFSNAKEMDDKIVTLWNETVKDDDIVYHLGDVYFNDWSALLKLKGRKRLVLGNHDNGKDQKLQGVFQKITVWRMFPEFGLLLTHVPVHQGSFNEKVLKNVHGHLHTNTIGDPRYVNVSVEQIDYRPIPLESIRVT